MKKTQQQRQELIEKATLLYGEVYRITFLKTKDAQGSQDIAQDVMRIVISKIHTLKNPDALKSWIMKITENEIKAYFKEQTQYRKYEIAAGQEHDKLIEQIEDLEEDILQKLSAAESQRNIIKALLQLEEKYQQVIREHIIYELTFDEVANKRNINRNTVRTRYFKGIKLLKAEFEKIENGRGSNGK